jgi:D-alanine-D-alanine ligase
LLCGGISSEDYLSRRSCESIWDHFNPQLYTRILVDWQKDGCFYEYWPDSRTEVKEIHPHIRSFFVQVKGDIIFNLLHGEKENHGKLQGLLQIFGIPYAGNGMEASVIGMNKLLSKRLFIQENIPVPAFCVINHFRHRDLEKDLDHALTKLGLPCIIKPILGGSSLGLYLAQSRQDLALYLQEILPLYEEVLIEEFIDGTEYSIGVLGSTREDVYRCLPVVRMEYSGPIFDAKIKYEDTYQSVYPSGLSGQHEQQLKDMAIRIHRSFKFEGPCRVDLRFKHNTPYILEVNTQPGLSSYSIYPKMLKHADISLADFVDTLIAWGIKRGAPI